MERGQLFDDFKGRVDEIMEHQDEISVLRFDARLKNGTRFSFDYDSERFEKAARADGQPRHRHPVSVFNAVLDIIAAMVAMNLMIVAGARAHGISDGAYACLLLTFISFFAMFTVSAVYHLFDEGHARTVRVLYSVRMALLAICVMLLADSMCLIGTQGSMLTFPVQLFLAALSVFLTSLSTKGGSRAASLMTSIAYLVSCAFVDLDVGTITVIALGTLSGMVPALVPSSSTRMRAAGTTGLFHLVTLIAFFQMAGMHW